MNKIRYNMDHFFENIFLTRVDITKHHSFIHAFQIFHNEAYQMSPVLFDNFVHCLRRGLTILYYPQ